MTFPTYAELVGHDFSDVDGLGQSHREWMAAVGFALSGGLIGSTTVHLDAAAISTLFSSPTIVVPAPGVGKFVLMQNLFVEYARIGSTWQPSGRIDLRWNLTERIGCSDTFTDLFQVADGNALKQETFGGTSAMATADGENQPIIVAATVADPPVVGVPTSFSIADGGSGYAVGDTGNLNGGGPNGTYEVTAVDGGGAVTAFDVTDPGDGYSADLVGASAQPDGVQPGSGSGFTYSVDGIPDATGDLYVTAFFQIIDLQ